MLAGRTVAGYDDTDTAVKLLIAAVDRPDPAPVWYTDWGTDAGGSTNNLKRALDRVLAERGPTGYAAFKARLRVICHGNVFGDHATKTNPPFPLLVDTFRPTLDGKRWYHRFSALTATAGGFNVQRDVLTGHGPLGALYPTNTTHPQKEGDTMTFLYLIPTGLGDPSKPGWGGWAGRDGPTQSSPAGHASGRIRRTPGVARPVATTPCSAGPTRFKVTFAPGSSGASGPSRHPAIHRTWWSTEWLGRVPFSWRHPPARR